ncbi:MAG TPA: ABC transporter ATP-binding protein [Anaerolinea sp.]|nr:ABC transporter ATP-binding protein [Anaerolinea sp.]
MLAVQMQGIVKRFGSLVANDHIQFDLAQGEIHALLGENGAGKTTLMRILYGLYTPDEGEILVQGSPVTIRSPKDAIQAGIGMVTQHFTLVPTLSVAENVVLGASGGVLDPRRMQGEVAAIAERYGMPVKPDALVRQLSVGEQQRVEILKALSHNARVLILDEPTAVLVPQEVDVLFEALNHLRGEGLSVIFISHKLHEVMSVCDRVTVLRDGRQVGTVEKTATNQTDLARLMVGRESFGVTRQGERSPGEVLLRVENLSARGRKGLTALKHVSFEVQAGEMLGIAGVSGNGQSELSQVLDGMLKPAEGRVWVAGREVTGATPGELLEAGVGRIPEDRHASVVGELSVAENLVLDQLERFTRSGMLDRPAIRKNAEQMIAEYAIKAAPDDRIRTLSGGNMQKVLLARNLSRNPRVVIAAEPTRGLDVGATDYVRGKLLEQRARGAAVLLISEDLDEIMALADRIAVIYEGSIMGILNSREASVEQLGLMMAGTPLDRLAQAMEGSHA